VSPYSLEFHQEAAHWAGVTLGPLAPVSLSPDRTALGLLFLVALSLLYGAVYREFAGERRGRTLAVTIVGVAVILTLVGFLQKSSSHPGTIYACGSRPSPERVRAVRQSQSLRGLRGHGAPDRDGAGARRAPGGEEALALRGPRDARESSASRFALFVSISVFLGAGVLAAGSRAA